MWTIIGSRGLIGTHLTEYLTMQGYEVKLWHRGSFNLFEGKLGHVIYSAGLTADFRQRPFDTVDAHVTLPAKLLQRASFDSFLYLSSTRVYAHASSGDEECPLPHRSQDPSDLYNLSKLMGESLCLQNSNPHVRIARLSNVISKRDVGSRNFISDVVTSARRGHIELRTALDSEKDYIHIDDVVELLPRISIHGIRRLYNVASGIQISNRELVAKLSSLSGCTHGADPLAPTIRFPNISIDRIKQEFQFAPRSVFDGLADLFRANLNK